MNSDRGVSEVLGYVLVIALVTVMIAMVMTVGISGLETSQQAEEVTNMERAFDVLTNNADTLVEQRSPRRATEFRIGDATMSLGDPVSINVTVDGERINNQTITSNPIVYEHAAGERIVYESGAVIRTGDAGSRMIDEPRIMTLDGKVVVHGIRMRAASDSATQIGDRGTALLRKDFIGTSRVETVATPADNISIEIESPRADAWETYFEEEGYDNVSRSPNGDVVTAEWTPEEETDVVLLRTVIRLTLTQ